jgi:MoaA/NifB/PqqE/SkfB family radical SAM enzyme
MTVVKNMAENKKQWIRLTKVCNQRCLFCLDSECQNGSMVPVAAILKELRHGIARGASRAVLSGGEATLHPDFLKIVERARKMGYGEIQVITNGQRLSDGQFFDAAIAAGVSEVTFSVHGHTAALHDALVGVKGAFINVLRALKNTKKYPGLIVSIDICINKANYRHLPEIVKTFLKMGFFEFDLLAVVPFGRAWDERNKMLFDFNKAVRYLKRTLVLGKYPGVHLWTNRLQAQYLEGNEAYIQSPDKLLDEIKGRREMFEDMLVNGVAPYCRGPRCAYCFIGALCNDASKLADGAALFTHALPKCFPKTEQERVSLKKKDIVKKRVVRLEKFFDFWKKNRYFVKSMRCGTCIYEKKCAGAPIGSIIKNGFKIVRPIKK